MQQKCEYCGNYINDTDAVCPHCGGVNENVMRSADGIPKTIAELKAYALQNNLPLEQMRFFIGENYTGARAFGIYEENGIYTVYKNKDNGERVIRAITVQTRPMPSTSCIRRCTLRSCSVSKSAPLPPQPVRADPPKKSP